MMSETHQDEIFKKSRLEHLTHFSDVVGASHSDRYTMWAEGTYATEGMKQLAEWGDTTKYEEEIKDK
uniref:Spondin domain-containing protein n=1 Tax=Romanomermis culicivorax TaxID=13658 RepID=A0A915I7Z7_ROMCU